MQNPFLVGKRIYLRPLKRTDLDDHYMEWFNDKEVSKFSSHAIFPYTEDDMLEYFEESKKSITMLPFAIIFKKNDKHIGNVSLQNINWVFRSAEFAIILGDKAYWKKGLGYEVGKLILDYAFERLNLNRVHCGTSVENIGMQQLAIRLGMKQEGRRRQAIYKWGKYADIAEYGILRSEYEKN